MNCSLRSGGQLVLALATAAAMTGGTGAGHLRKVWGFEIGTNVKVPRSGSGEPLGVYALSFSPDGHRIAAVVGSSPREEGVLLLDATNPQNGITSLDVNPMVQEADIYAYGIGAFRWSASGQQTLLNGLKVDVSNGRTCSLPQSDAHYYYFVGPDRIVGKEWNSKHLSLFDLDCHRLEAQNLGNDWEIYDASAERGLICVKRDLHSMHSVRWSVLGMDGTEKFNRIQLPFKAAFADGGNSLCIIRGAEWDRTVACMGDSGNEIGASKGWTAVDIRPALHARRVILSLYTRKFDWIDLRWAMGSLARRVVWDFGTGKQLASWRPKSQMVGTATLPYVAQMEPYRFAISPDGEYVVEGGAGTLVLYKVEP